MIKRIILSVIMLCVALTSPSAAEHRDRKIESLMRWAGCTAALTTSDEVPIERSVYAYDEHRLYIGTQPGDPENVYLGVTLHEIGHCLQMQEGVLLNRGSVERELDADRRAADLACAMGRDGREILHELMVWAKEKFDYDGDDSHGTSAQRIQIGREAPACRVQPTQAPYSA